MRAVCTRHAERRGFYAMNSERGLAQTAARPTRGRAGLAPAHDVDARAFWLAQARHALRRARGWLTRFGGPMHWVALFWFFDELAVAERYRTWARERTKSNLGSVA